jgi:ribosomal protein L31E
MAKEKEEETKIVLEREYNVPLRREFIKTANWKKTKKASKALREFLVKHMKPEGMDGGNVKIGKYLNEELWKHGIRNPPHHVKLIAKKDDKGIVTAELVGAPEEKPKEGEKKEAPAASKKEEKKAGEEKAPEKKEEEPKKEVSKK